MTEEKKRRTRILCIEKKFIVFDENNTSKKAFEFLNKVKDNEKIILKLIIGEGIGFVEEARQLSKEGIQSILNSCRETEGESFTNILKDKLSKCGNIKYL
jgi:hypothetical protein